MNSITFRKPNDWHVHLRDDDMLPITVESQEACYSSALIMPNLQPPIINAQQAEEYRQRILGHVPKESSFVPYMTLYLTDNTTPADIVAASRHPYIVACKLYPAGATTNSAAGVTDIKNIYPALEAMQKEGMILCLHGEVTHGDIFDREAKFIHEILIPLQHHFPYLKVIFEHITSKAAAEYVFEASENTAATITPQHLLINRNHMLVGGIRPHYYCLPILKADSDREALVKVATSGNPRFFLGTDSAPHRVGDKQSACGCAGCFNVLTSIPVYLEVFYAANALLHIEAFASINGCNFYGIEPSCELVKYKREEVESPGSIQFSDNIKDLLLPFSPPSGKLQWKLVD